MDKDTKILTQEAILLLNKMLDSNSEADDASAYRLGYDTVSGYDKEEYETRVLSNFDNIRF